MRLVKGCSIIVIILALTLGCAPKRLPEERGERIPLSQVLMRTLKQYEGINTLQTPISVKLDMGGDLYLLRGFFLYENPASLRLRLAASLGPTVGEVIYTDGLLAILVPSEAKIYQGWIGEGEHRALETIVLTMVYTDYAQIEGRGFPTRIYGEGEGLGVRFDIKLKDPQVDVILPEGVFSPPTEGWEVHPLEELKDLLQGVDGGIGP